MTKFPEVKYASSVLVLDLVFDIGFAQDFRCHFKLNALEDMLIVEVAGQFDFCGQVLHTYQRKSNMQEHFSKKANICLTQSTFAPIAALFINLFNRWALASFMSSH